jgi:DNA-binding MarR family transcriptional regulator
MSSKLQRQAERLYREFSGLVRAYQFRDRDAICGYGISVTQCYALDTLDTSGPLATGDLAARLHVELSTMTRAIDRLVADGLVARSRDKEDRRVCRIRISPAGRRLVTRSRADLIREEMEVLRNVPPEAREAVITAIADLRAAFTTRQSCAADAEQGPRRAATGK